jgi:hypothetical protein
VLVPEKRRASASRSMYECANRASVGEGMITPTALLFGQPVWCAMNEGACIS